MIEALTSSPLARATGVALVDFVWQGAAIGVAVWLARLALRRASPGARYLVACVGLGLMLAAPFVGGARALRPGAPASVMVAAPASVISTRATDPVPPDRAAAVSGALEPSAVMPFHVRTWIDARLPWIVLAWAAGVFLLALHVLGGLWRLRLIRRSAEPVSAGQAYEIAETVARRLGLRGRVELRATARMCVPAVIGWLKAVILVPASLLAGVPASCLEAVLAHELAHVRRADYVVNLLQCAAELLLFYHPAVWWVSRQIRLERELCADDLAASVTGDRVTYARALASLEAGRAGSPALAVGGGGHLLYRIRRLIEPGVPPPAGAPGGMAMIVLTLFVMLVFADVAPGHGPAMAVIGPTLVEPAPVSTGSDPVAAPEPPASVTPSGRRDPYQIRLAGPTEPAPGTQQTERAAVAGVVRDRDGGTIPGATVTLTSVAVEGRLTSPVTRRAVTNPMGAFTFDELSAGEYDVTVSIVGFRTHRSRVQVAADATVAVIVHLELGALSEHVTVRSGTAAAPASLEPARTAADFFDLAKAYYEQGRLAEAEEMTTRALQILRAETPAATVGVLPPVTGPIRVGGSIREPRKVRDVVPVYPADAAAAGTQGTVIIEATIDRSGTVKDAHVLRSIPGLDEAALAAVRQWLYTPTMLNGAPVEILMTVAVTFVR